MRGSTWVQKEGVTYCGESLIPFITVVLAAVLPLSTCGPIGFYSRYSLHSYTAFLQTTPSTCTPSVWAVAQLQSAPGASSGSTYHQAGLSPSSSKGNGAPQHAHTRASTEYAHARTCMLMHAYAYACICLCIHTPPSLSKGNGAPANGFDSGEQDEPTRPLLTNQGREEPAGAGCRVQGAGCRVQGAGCRV